MATGYKIRGGKPVRRTEKEQADLDQLKIEYIGRSKTTPRPPQSPQSPRLEEGFSQITESQTEKLWRLGPSWCATVFLVLWYQGFRHHFKPFLMPTEAFLKQGISRSTQRRVLNQLEKVGLILVSRRPPQPPSITVFER